MKKLTEKTQYFMALMMATAIAHADDLDDLEEKTQSFLDSTIGMITGWGTAIFTIAFMACGIMFLKGRWPKEYMMNSLIGAGIFGLSGLIAAAMHSMFS